MSTVEYLNPETQTWVQRTAEDTLDMVADPFWRTRQSSIASKDAIIIRCGVGFVKRSTDGGENWSDITPGTNPPNDAGDTPAPTNTGVTYKQLDGSYISQGTFVVIANWQNATNDWRCWIALTTNDGTSWSWKYLGQDVSCIGESSGNECLNPTIIENDVPGLGSHIGGPAGYQSEQCVELDTNKFVLFKRVPRDLGGTNFHFKIFEIEADGTVTWGSDYIIVLWPSVGLCKIVKVSTTKFAVLRWSGEKHQVLVFTFSGLTITSHATNNTRTAAEIGFNESDPPASQDESDIYRAAAIFSNGTNIWIYAHTKLPVDTDTCDLPYTTYYNVSSLKGTISGNTITWDAGPDCTDQNENPQPTYAWTVLYTGIHSNLRFIVQIGSLNIDDGGHSIFFYQDYENDPGYPLTVWCFDGTTNGAKVTLTGTDTNQLTLKSPVDSRGSYNLIRLTDTLFIITLKVSLAGPPPEYDDLPYALYCWAVSRSGTTLTCGPLFKAHEGLDLDNRILDFGVVRQSASEFFLVFYDDSICGTSPTTTLCINAKKFSVSARNISLEEECYGWLDRRYLKQGTVSTRSMGVVVPTVRNIDEDHVFINSSRDFRLGDDGAKSNYIDISDASFAECPQPGYQDARGLGVSLGKGLGTRAWITISNGSTIALVDIAVPALTESARRSLGAATEAEVISRSRYALPFADFSGEDSVTVFGNMDDPYSLGDPAHIIYSDDAGVTASLVENDWSVDHCGALLVTTAGIVIAIRNRGGQAKLYMDNNDFNLLLKVTLPFDNNVQPHGLAYDYTNNTIYICSGYGDAFMIIIVNPPYVSTKNITYNHGTTEGVNAVAIL